MRRDDVKRLGVWLISLTMGLSLSHSGDEMIAAPRDPYMLSLAKPGKVLDTPLLKAVFWGPEWHDPAFAGDIITGIDSLLAGYSGSAYAAVLREYYDRAGAITG
jgi:hypothetical protein